MPFRIDLQKAPLFATKGLASFAVGLLLSTIAVAQGDETEEPLFGFVIRNSLIESRFTRTRSEQEAVSKSLMNSSVTGTQSTVTETRVRFLPDSKSLKFELLNSGNVTSQTTGFNSQATVDSVGTHRFEIIKPLWFDGTRFLTLPAHGTIQASQTPQRVFSAVGAQMPLLGPLGDRVAWNEVLRRTPQINQVVAEDVSRDVLPRIDRLVDADFARLQKQWTAAHKKVAAAFGKTPLKWAARSQNEVVSVWTVRDGSRQAASPGEIPLAISALRKDEAVALFLTEETVAALVDQYVPGGLKLTDTQLQKLQLASSNSDSTTGLSLETLLDLSSALRGASAEEAAFFTIEFAPQQPIQIQFVNGDIRLNATFQIIPKAGSPSGWMTTSFNMRGKRLTENQWTVAVRSVDVGEGPEDTSSIVSGDESTEPYPLIIPVKAEDDPQPVLKDEGVTTVQSGTVWMPIIRNAAESLAEKIPPVKLPIEFDGSETIPGAPRFRLGKIDSAKGVLRIGLRVVESVPDPVAR